MNTPAPWTVSLARTAAKQLDRFPGHDSDAIRAALKVLARDPLMAARLSDTRTAREWNSLAESLQVV
jgi:hypothetical protein